MASIHDSISEQFYRWEKRGRGWQIWPHSVSPEPPFSPFQGYRFPDGEVIDDGCKPTFLSSLVQRLSRSLATTPPTTTEQEPEEPEEEPDILSRSDLVELQVSLPAKFSAKPQDFTDLLMQLAFCREPVAFEILGTAESISVQFTAHPADAVIFQRQLKAYFPEVIVTETEGTLKRTWESLEDGESLVIEFGLAREYIYPLACPNADPWIALIATLTELAPSECGLFQVMFQSVEHPWADNIMRAVADPIGKPIFCNAPELVKMTQEKISSPLFATVVRIATRSEDFDRAAKVARDMASALRLFSRLNGNEFIPLRNDEYPLEAHVEDVVKRQCRRNGMILNTDELTGLVHLPSATVRSSKLRQEWVKSMAAPKANTQAQTGLLLGQNVHAGQTRDVRLSPDERCRHLHMIGASGTGKSTLLFNLIRQDILNGEGLAVLDPHGDLVDRILGIIPPERVNDVVLIDPADETHSVGFNILSAHTDLEKTLLASDLISVFQRLSTSWGDQMAIVLQNAILAFLESSEGGTLSDLRRFLVEPNFREKFLATVNDPDIVYYWRKDFAQLTGNKSIGPVLTRLQTFLSPKPIRYMVSQRENRLDFASFMDKGKIFLAKLSQGQIGKENAFLLGSLFVAKFQETAMSRQAQDLAARRPFYLYIDEFQNFITPSMAEILSSARKYRLGLILAHQELRQLERDREVASAVLSNSYTRIVFRVGDADAKALENGFSSFEARDLQNLKTGQAIARIEKADGDFNLSIPISEDVEPDQARTTRHAVIAASRAKYATARGEVEAALLAKLTPVEVKPEPAKAKPIIPPPTPKESEPEVVEVEKPTDSKKKVLPPDPAPPQPVQDSDKKPAKAEKSKRPEKEILPPVLPPEPKPVPPPVAPVAIPVEEAPAAPIREAAPPRDLGRGGAQHQAVVYRVKEEAEALGFRSTIEKQVLDGKGSVDLHLERGDQTFACEISVTTTIDHEVGNVTKCLKAGFAEVVVICLDDDRLEKLKTAISRSLGLESSAQVQYFQPDQFIAHLKALPPPPPAAPEAPKIRRGYKVKRTVSKLGPEEQQQREEEAIRSVAEALKKKNK